MNAKNSLSSRTPGKRQTAYILDSCTKKNQFLVHESKMYAAQFDLMQKHITDRSTSAKKKNTSQWITDRRVYTGELRSSSPGLHSACIML